MVFPDVGLAPSACTCTLTRGGINCGNAGEPGGGFGGVGFGVAIVFGGVLESTIWNGKGNVWLPVGRGWGWVCEGE